MYHLAMITPAGHWTESQPLTVSTVAEGALPAMVAEMRRFVAAGWPEGFVVLRDDGHIVTGV